MRSLIFRILLVAATSATVISAQTEPAKDSTDSGSSGQENHAVIEAPQPVYPKSGRKDKISGGVTVRVTIDETGQVISAKVIKGLEHPDFRESAVAAAKKARFHPLVRDGKPVKVIRTLEYNFILEDDGFDEKYIPLTIGFFLKLSAAFADHPKLLMESFGGVDLFLEAAEETKFAEAFVGLKNYSLLAPTKRREEVENVLIAIKKLSTPDEQWQIDMGEQLGSVFGPVMLLAILEKEEEILLMESTEAKNHFAAILNLAKNPPKDFDAALLQKLRNLGETSSVDQPFSRENLLTTMAKFMEFADSIFPENNEK